jgi:hypothetical protein
MNSASFAGLTRLSRPTRPTIWLILLGAVAVLWPLYVYDSSQAAWLAATALLAVLSWDLAAVRSPLLAALLLGVVAILGTEVNGDLAAGHAPLGTLRTLDIVVAAALAPRLLDVRTAAKLRWPSAPVLLILALLAYALVLWGLNGHPTDNLVRADVRLVGLAFATWLAVRQLGPWKIEWVARACAALVLLTAAKAVALYVNDYWTIGTYDRVQAATVQPDGETLRLILVGGDSLMIVAPAGLLALAFGVSRGSTRWLLGIAGGGAFVGLLMSGTRTSLLIALLLLAGIAVFEVLRRNRRALSWRSIIGIVVAGSVLATSATAMGITGRLLEKDAPGTGLDFRRQEIRSFLDLPLKDIVVGQGFGGRYVGRSVLGTPVEAGWSHAFPAFIVLKVGLIGLFATVVLLVAAARSTVRAYVRDGAPGDRGLTMCGAAAVIGVLAMSLTLGRVALPDGAMMLVLGLAMMPSFKPPSV